MTAKKKTTAKKTTGKKPAPSRNSPRQAIAAALEIQEPVQFMFAMSDIFNGPFPMVALTDRPKMAATVGGLYMLDISLSNGGLRQFIDQWEGGFFHEIESYCRAIGAVRASGYLQEAAKLFPKGRVPRDEEKRYDLASAYEQTSPLDPPDPFIALDRKYEKEVGEEIPAKLREWVAANADALASELDAA